MSDKQPFFPNTKAEGPKSRWAGALSALINLLLVVILAGPWVWAYFSSSSSETPGHYLENWFHSVRVREESSWQKMREPTDADDEDIGRKNVNQALDRVEAALKKPVLDRAEIQHALDDVAAARKEVQGDVTNFVKGKSLERAATEAPVHSGNSK